MARLTKRKVESQPPEEKDIILWDGELKGFGCKITPKGRRTYFAYYRTRDGQQRRPTIGVHGAITCEDARETARQWLAEAGKGGDPSALRQAKRAAPTITALAERYMAEYAYRRNKEKKSASNDEILWRLHILPVLGMKKIHAVKRDDVDRLHKRMADHPTNANRMMSLLSKAFNLAEVWEYRPDGSNPCRHVERFPEVKRERYLNPNELQQLGKALVNVEKERWDTPSIVPLIRLLIFTGCRLREIMTAKWEWVDFEKGELKLPTSKTGKKTVLLTPPALTVLSSIDRTNDNPFIIAGRRPGKHLINPLKPWRRICERARLSDLRIHDLRHTFASAGAGGGLSLPIIGALLHHKLSATTDRYAHLFDDPLRAAAETTAKTLEGWLKGEEGADIIELKGAPE